MHVATLERAKAGDGDAFAELTAPHRGELHLHCYRMLGSVTDADDLLQETMIAAWQGLDGFAQRSSLRAWLYRIATNRCLNAIRASKRRPPPTPVPPFEPPEPSRRAEVTWLQPYPDAWLGGIAEPATEPSVRVQTRESIRLAFVVALQKLPPRQAAVLVLRDVLGFSATEVAEMLGSSSTVVKGLLQRARASRAGTWLDDAAVPDSKADADLARRFADAYSANDVDALLALLTDDCWLAMPPAPHEYHGTEAVAAFLRVSIAGRAHRRIELAPTRANGQPAFTCLLQSTDGAAMEPSGVIVLTLSAGQIAGVTRFLDRGLPAVFTC